ncbi:MAG: hypothetical protein A3F31_04015 [Candidatus Levybacteria bacterium RIFCSPHIGHO2_12_FULL_38_12]|nr:MAG: hypothetical protein A2770_02405 [Candidatus Levybacteria bacterium RIFCSPHIGHO2_01_FULL_38_12]OGH21931.1 MAG: hypothetical protein A3D75_00625 [Candidatus Levybacteria bacterium RIFCSPHIGHO2_02_FULL_37_18]OGH22863.1 MAG: hypothetical protein A3F31_04015 [Candidatus Levybacteria bacterium RIFCSPHIGHO2_12_FULL_38_12]OGH33588.1 MAG: hypothetical protein A3A47_01970 [Candidatus Levybacteria bacterium RIFCSPLOWO2_01_FULL_37_20]OGH44509.1 MAG: hypothetical protein A3J14_03660 [Candidatus Lev
MIKIDKKTEWETVYVCLLAVFVSSFFVWQSNKDFGKKFFSSVPILAGSKNTIVSPVPSSTLDIETASQVSPDGTKKLHLKIMHNKDLTKTYIFTVSDSLDKDKKLLFQQTLHESESMGLPFNAWSPDNKFLFIYKNDSNALLFKASGELFTNDQVRYLSVLDIFKEKNKTNRLLEITGWASQDLLIVNTLDGNNQNSSFWLEIPSKAIIPLASQF